jgi:hypothetical protein
MGPVSGGRASQFATDLRIVAEQAGVVAAAWSSSGAPASWALTAAQFEALRDEREMLEIAAMIPPDRLPPLLFQAAATFLVLKLEPMPMRGWFPTVGEPQAPLGKGFHAAYRGFCLDHREQLLDLCASHRYQMSEVGRCADILPALTPLVDDDRELVLIDLGTGAGLTLHLDRYSYRYRAADGDLLSLDAEDSDVVIETQVRGSMPPVPSAAPVIVDRIGVDVERSDLADTEVRDWLAACIPQEIDAVTRFYNAAAVAVASPARMVRGDADSVLPGLLESVPPGPTVCLIDTYLHVFFTPEQIRRYHQIIDRFGAQRDLDWVSVDPLVPMGRSADRSVLGLPIPPALVQRNRREGVFGLIGRVTYRGGDRSSRLLGIAHPGAAWLEWLAGDPEPPGYTR